MDSCQDKHRTIVALLIGTCGAVSTLGIILLAMMDKEIPPSLTGLVGAAIGYLAGFLTPAALTLERRLPPPPDHTPAPRP